MRGNLLVSEVGAIADRHEQVASTGAAMPHCDNLTVARATPLAARNHRKWCGGVSTRVLYLI
jgi:hypothetical protein